MYKLKIYIHELVLWLLADFWVFFVPLLFLVLVIKLVIGIVAKEEQEPACCARKDLH